MYFFTYKLLAFERLHSYMAGKFRTIYFGISWICVWIYFNTFLWKIVLNLNLQIPSLQFSCNFCFFFENGGYEVSIADFGLGARGSNPLGGPDFFEFFFYLDCCGKRVYSAIFKMGSIIFVTYQKLEKNAFEGIQRKKTCQRPDSNRGPWDQKLTALTIQPPDSCYRKFQKL